MTSSPVSEESEFRNSRAPLFQRKSRVHHSPPSDEQVMTGRPPESLPSRICGQSPNSKEQTPKGTAISAATVDGSHSHAVRRTKSFSRQPQPSTRFRGSLNSGASGTAAAAGVQPYLNCVRSLKELESNQRRLQERRVSFSENIFILERVGHHDVVTCEALK